MSSAVNKVLLFLLQFILAVNAQDDVENLEETFVREPVKGNPKLAGAKGGKPPMPEMYWKAKPGVCEDNPRHLKDCRTWAQLGYCTDRTMGDYYPNWMGDNCMLSCKICEPPSTVMATALFVFKILTVLFYYAWFFEVVHKFVDFPKPRQLSTLFLPQRKLVRLVLLLLPLLALYFL